MSDAELPRLAGLRETYELVRRLGTGGMGRILLVRHRRLDELRVLKVMRAEIADDPRLRQRFEREARMAAQLRHPHLAQIHDYASSESGEAYLVLEYIDGLTFAQVLRARPLLPLRLAVELARQAAAAIGFLHGRSIVHRDIAPDNLMLTRGADGEPLVKLIDLGVAKPLEGSGLTSAGAFLGKMWYASPEQLEGGLGEHGTIGPASDVYSLGLVLYELFTGAFPFGGSTHADAVQAHLFRAPTPFATSDPEGRLPEELRALLLACLEKAPARRPATARLVAARLQALEPSLAAEAESGEAALARLLGGGAVGDGRPSAAGTAPLAPDPATRPEPAGSVPAAGGPSPPPSAAPPPEEPAARVTRAWEAPALAPELAPDPERAPPPSPPPPTPSPPPLPPSLRSPPPPLAATPPLPPPPPVPPPMMPPPAAVSPRAAPRPASRPVAAAARRTRLLATLGLTLVVLLLLLLLAAGAWWWRTRPATRIAAPVPAATPAPPLRASGVLVIAARPSAGGEGAAAPAPAPLVTPSPHASVAETRETAAAREARREHRLAERAAVPSSPPPSRPRDGEAAVAFTPAGAPVPSAAPRPRVEPAVAAGQPAAGRARLFGVVRGTDGAPVAGATIRLEPLEGGERAAATTGADGAYVFAALTPGRYEATIERQGFAAAQVRFRLVAGRQQFNAGLQPSEP